MGGGYFQEEGQEKILLCMGVTTWNIRIWGGGGCFVNSTWSAKKGTSAKMQKIINYQTLKNFPRSFRSLGILQNSYFWSSLPPCPSSICKISFFFSFFLSSHRDTNPLLHLYHFRKKNIYILANIKQWIIKGHIFLFYCLHPVGQTFLDPSKFCNHLKHSTN